MSAVKRSLQDRYHTARGQNQSELPSHKRLKSIHHVDGKADRLAALLTDPTHQLTARLTNGVTNKAASRVDESNAVIAMGPNGDAQHAISVSSNEELSSDEDDGDDDGDDDHNGDGDDDEVEEEDDADGDDVDKTHIALTNGVSRSVDHDTEMVEADEEIEDGLQLRGEGEGDEEEPEELSFGDMLKARHPDVITIAAETSGETGERTLQPVTGYSLGTVLQQALRTNDKDLLERCFELRDVQAIKNTIQRLPSPLVGDLLSRVSERMYRRPGRAGVLMIWIQWSLVAHGGYLAGQPDILRRLTALNQVVKQRAQGLQPLLQLKGKLDMLHAQLELRRETQASRHNLVDDDEEDERVVYREGDVEADWTDDPTDQALIQLDSSRSQKEVLEEESSESIQEDGSDDDQSDGTRPVQESMADIEAGEDDESELEEEGDEREDEEGDDSEENASETSFHTSEDDDDDDDDNDSPLPRR